MLPYLPVPLAALYAFMAWRMLGHTEHAAPNWLRTLLPLALLAHGALLYDSLFGAHALRLGFGNSVSAVAWLTALTYWLSSRGAPLLRLQAWVNAGAAGALLLMALVESTHTIPNSDRPELRVHLAVAFLAYALLAVAALHAVFMTLLEKRLHRGGLPDNNLPPLLTLEALLFRTLAAGFVLLTLTVASGILFSEELFGQPFTFTHKVVLALLSWATFGVLLAGRHFRGWRGRTALNWTMAGFVLLILAYLGTQFVMQVLLGR